MKLNVPFISQYELPRDPDGLGRACGIACVKMIIDFMDNEKISLTELLEESNLIKGAYLPGIGWTNMGITALLRNHNISCYSEEFRVVLNDTVNQKVLPSPLEASYIEKGIVKIAEEVGVGHPVIISGIKNWKEKDKMHKMLIIGVEKDAEKITGFYYHNSDDENKDGKDNFVDIETFRTYWRKFAIFVY